MNKRTDALLQDEKLRDRLRDLDGSYVRVAAWEAVFIEGICCGDGEHGLLSVAQRAKSMEILERYAY